jgi:sugar phosphate permease
VSGTSAEQRRLRRGRWLVLSVPAALYIVSYVHRIAPAVVAADLMRSFSITASTLGNLAAIYPYVFVVMALGAGTLTETLGPRRTLALGGATMAAGAALFGLAPTFGFAYAGRLLVATGASVVFIAWLTLAAAWFRPADFATVSGWSQTVGNLGALAASSPLALVVETAGWRLTFLAIGAASLLVGLLVLLLVRDRPEAGGETAGRRPPNASLGAVLRAVPAVVTNRRTWPPALAGGFLYGSLVAFQGLWAVPYLTQVYGVGRVSAANIVALLAIGMAVGSPIVGWLSDVVLTRRRLPMIAATGLFAACWLPLGAPGVPRLDAAWLPPLFFVMGFASSAVVLMWTGVREVNDPGRVGIAVSFCNIPVFLSVALMQWLTGVVLDGRWGGAMVAGARVYPAAAYEAVFFLCLVVAVAAFVAACLMTETRGRNLWAVADSPTR